MRVGAVLPRTLFVKMLKSARRANTVVTIRYFGGLFENCATNFPNVLFTIEPGRRGNCNLATSPADMSARRVRILRLDFPRNF